MKSSDSFHLSVQKYTFAALGSRRFLYRPQGDIPSQIRLKAAEKLGEIRTHVTRINWQEATIWTLHRSSLFCPFRVFAQEIRNLTGFTFFLIFFFGFVECVSCAVEVVVVWGCGLASYFSVIAICESQRGTCKANFIFHRNKSSL